jgi:UDP-glucose 4-epimerase
VDAVIHTAARVHALADNASHAPLYMETNVRGTLRLAQAASLHGARRFIFLSSIKVNGEETTDVAFTAADAPRPGDAYGLSKWQAEQGLRELVRQGGMSLAVVRPPLIYGPGVRANFLRVMSWVDSGRPLPFVAVKNRRSLVNVWNLADLLVTLLERASLVTDTWLVSDGEDLSTPELIRCIGVALGRRPRMLPVPELLFRLAGRLVGKPEYVRRLCGSLVVDMAPTRRDLGWEPRVTVSEALARTASWLHSRDVDAA